MRLHYATWNRQAQAERAQRLPRAALRAAPSSSPTAGTADRRASSPRSVSPRWPPPAAPPPARSAVSTATSRSTKRWRRRAPSAAPRPCPCPRISRKDSATRPAATAKAIALAAETGLVGGSIEDATGRKDAPIFDLGFATERVAAAVEAARKLPFPFTLTARAENYLHGRPDLDDTIKRLQAFERAGADVLFAPGLPDLAAVRTVCSSLSKPVNFMVGIRGKSFSVAELADAGVRRISLATSLYRAAMTGLADAAREIRESGTFGYLDSSMSSGEFAKYIQG